MYRFYINPFNGPDLWPLLDSHIILTLLDYHTPIRRPSKKRKKSAAELYDGMVKDGKLSRSGKIVTCLKCGEKGHNSRSCKVQRGSQSTARPMPSQRGSQPTQMPSQATVNHSAPAVNITPSAQSNVTLSASAMRFSKATTSRLSPAKKTSSRGKRKVGE
ncbi:mutator type transposase [Tanacetum coccineum]